MALSASYDAVSTVTRDDIIKFALRKAKVLKRGQTLGADDIADAAFALNLIIKQLQGRSDGAANIKMWLRKRLVLFLQDAQYEYHIGAAAADYCANVDDLLETTLSAAAASGASTLTLTSVTGAADTYYIGVRQDNNVIHWTTINGAPSGSVVTLTDVTTYAAAAGNGVYVYSTKVQPPLEILTQQYRDESGNDRPLGSLTLEEYDALPDKDASGTPGSFFYERTLSEGVFYFDSAVEDTRDTVRLTVRYPAQDMDTTSDNFDFQDIWLRPLGYLLAIDMAPEYGVPVDQDLFTLAKDAMSIAMDADPENSTDCFEPGRD